MAISWQEKEEKEGRQYVETVDVQFASDVKKALEEKIVEKNAEGYRLVASMSNPLDPHQILLFFDYKCNDPQILC